MTLTVHHLQYSQSFRVVWLLEELGMEYELKIYKRLPSGLAPDELKHISPLGTSPVITNDEVTLCESNAILEYLLDKAGDSGTGLRPGIGDPLRTKYLFWFHAAQGSLTPVMLSDSLWRNTISKVPWPISWIIKFVYGKVQSAFLLPRLTKLLELAEQEKQFMGGNRLTLADISLIYPMESALTRYPDMAKAYPNCEAWLKRMSERKAFQRAMQKLGQESIAYSV